MAYDSNTASASCEVASKCGGCTGIGVLYSQQLAEKDAVIQELFAPFLEASSVQVLPIIGANDPFHYRNKVASPYAPGKRGPNGGREILFGMFESGSHRIIPTPHCWIENEQAQQVIRAIPPLMKRYKIAPYDEDKHRGFLRYAIVRVGHESGEVLVTLVTNGEDFPASRNFCRDLVKKCPFITSIVQNINTAQTNTILGKRERRLYGPGFILDTLCGLSFKISSQSFYQVNSQQTARLYEKALELANLQGNETVIDAYCGTGTIGLVAAKNGAARVIGIDNVESAIRDARENAKHNGIENAEFFVADAGEFMQREAVGVAEMGSSDIDGTQELHSKEKPLVDVVFTDPPRSGCSPEFLQALAQLAPERIVYISCNPYTQVRDLKYLCDHGYVLEVVQPVDMFPHTQHTESIALLQKSSHK